MIAMAKPYKCTRCGAAIIPGMRCAHYTIGTYDGESPTAAIDADARPSEAVAEHMFSLGYHYDLGAAALKDLPGDRQVRVSHLTEAQDCVAPADLDAPAFATIGRCHEYQETDELLFADTLRELLELIENRIAG